MSLTWRSGPPSPGRARLLHFGSVRAVALPKHHFAGAPAAVPQSIPPCARARFDGGTLQALAWPARFEPREATRRAPRLRVRPGAASPALGRPSRPPGARPWLSRRREPKAGVGSPRAAPGSGRPATRRAQSRSARVPRPSVPEPTATARSRSTGRFRQGGRPRVNAGVREKSGVSAGLLAAMVLAYVKGYGRRRAPGREEAVASRV